MVSRIDIEHNPEAEKTQDEARAKMKAEIKEEIKKDEKRSKRRKFCTCCLLELLILIFIFGSPVYILAKTGIVNIPVISPLVYNPPQLVRTLTFKSGEEGKLSVGIQQKLLLMAVSQKQEKTLVLTEKELTALLRQQVNKLLAQGTGAGLPLQLQIENSQILITPTGLQVFLQTKQPLSLAVTLNARLLFENGKLGLSPEKLKIGDWTAPQIAVDWLWQKYLGKQIFSLQQIMGKLPIKNIELTEGAVVISLRN